jgi:ubiquinone/menaquinone biosynthesis C-methylase UbiE
MPSRVLENRARYDRMAPFYEWAVRRGQFARFYRAVADAIEPDPGALLLDVGCGPGSLVPYLLPKVGEGGAVLGADVSDEMIGRARAAAAENGWPNVRFERSDARDFAPDRPAGIVVLCLALTAMPEPARCFARALSWLRPGGQLVVLDSFLEPRRRLASLVIRIKSPLVGADPSGVSLAELASQLDAARVRRLQAGVYTLLSGRAPRAGAGAAGR